MIQFAASSEKLRFGGRSETTFEPANKSLNDDDLARFLEFLSPRFVKQDATFPPDDVPEPGSEEMRDLIAHWIGRVWMHEHPMPGPDQLPAFDILSLQDDCLAWLDRNGGHLFEYGLTVEEIWVSQQLYQRQEFTLVLCDRFEGELTPLVSNRLMLDAQTLVWVLAAMCVDPRVPISRGWNVLVAHGQTAHTVSLRGLNAIPFDHPNGDVEIPEGWFTFDDPWPARSLLTRKGEPEITVLENIAMPPYWLISPEDLSKVVVGLLFPTRDFDIIEDMVSGLRQVGLGHGSRNRAPWFESQGSAELFPLLRAIGDPLSTLYSSQVGLAQIALLHERVEEAQELLEAAFALRPSEESRILFTNILREFKQPDLAEHWRTKSLS